MNDEQKNILIIGGATGGHLFPALALAEELETEKDVRLVLVLTQRAERIMPQPLLANCTYVVVAPIKPWWNILALIHSFLQAVRIIANYKPGVIVAFGSSLAFSLVGVGWCARIPIVIHEQNAAFGLANQVLRPLARKIALSFPDPKKRTSRKYVYTGNLMRRNVREHACRPGTGEKGEKCTLLILGGSQGAQFINTIIVALCETLNPCERDTLRIIHQVGYASNLSLIDACYSEVGIEHRVFRFDAQIGEYYTQADIAIARAGAGTIAELLAFGIPTILIPYPHARAHQLQNAQWLAQHEAGIVLKQQGLTPQELGAALFNLVDNPTYRNELESRLKRLATFNATEILAREVMGLA